MKKLFMNQSGFSLVQGMILAGVLAGSGLVATKMLNEQKMIQKGIETKDQIEELHNVVYSALQNNGNCSATMLANSVADDMSTGSALKTLPINYIRTESGDVIIQKYDNTQSADENLRNRTYMSGNVQIKDINVKYNPATTNGMGEIEIIYERLQSGKGAAAADDGKRRMKSGYGGKTIKKTIGMRVQRNPVMASRPFTSCYAVTSQNTNTVPGVSAEIGNQDIGKSLCLEMISSVGAGEIPAFRWDDATSSCLPNSACPSHQIYTGVSTTGAVRCRNLNEWVDFNPMIEATEGTCSPGQSAGFVITSTNPVRVKIRCN